MVWPILISVAEAPGPYLACANAPELGERQMSVAAATLRLLHGNMSFLLMHIVRGADGKRLPRISGSARGAQRVFKPTKPPRSTESGCFGQRKGPARIDGEVAIQERGEAERQFRRWQRNRRGE